MRALSRVCLRRAVFTWCAPALWIPRPASKRVLTPARRFIFTYGSLIYTLMGKKSEAAFARSWGVSYGLNCATEWRGIIVEAAKGAFVLAILERLCLTRAQPWLEGTRPDKAAAALPADLARASLIADAVDYESLKALMFKRSDAGHIAQIRTMYAHTKRISQ